MCHIALFELYVASILLLCSGDIETNPGPVYVVCPNCNTEVHIKKKICQCVTGLRNVLDVHVVQLDVLAFMHRLDIQ